MKKWIAFCLTFVLVMSMCLGAHAATQEEILGVWDVDMVNAYMVDGYTEEEARVLVAQPNAISTTVEFRADGKFITTQYVAGTVVGQGEGGYSLTGQLIVVDGVGAAQLVVEGNTLKFIELNGLVSLIATRQAAAQTPATLNLFQAPSAPAAGSDLVGVWDMDSQALMALGGMSAEEMEAMAPLLNLMQSTMEFTADGRVIVASYISGQEINRDEKRYQLEGNSFVVEGGRTQFVITGDTLVIMANGNSLTLRRSAAQGAAQQPVQVPVQTPANPKDALIGRWLLDYEELLVSRGFTASDLEAHRAEIDATTITMEFTADGRWISLQTGPAGTVREEETYMILNGVLYVGVNVMDFSIEGDCLTFTMVDNGIVMHLYRMN